MQSKKIKRISILQVLSVLAISIIFISIGIAYFKDVQKVVEKEEEIISEELLQQKHLVDTRMAEIFDRAKLSKDWLEEVPDSEIESINISDYNWIYHDELKVTYLDEADQNLGSVFINGKIEDINEEQLIEIKRMLATFYMQSFMSNHVTFDNYSVYYTDVDIIGGYPYSNVESVFYLDGPSSEEVFAYIAENIRLLREEGSAEEKNNGWESNLSPNYDDKDVLFMRNWAVSVDGGIRGIYQSGFNLEPLDNVFNISYENDYLVIVDEANQLAYDNGRKLTDVEAFELVDINHLESYIDNPYGEGFYKKAGEKLTFIIDLDETNWTMIYILNNGLKKNAMVSVMPKYFIYTILSIILSIGLMYSVNLLNKKRIREEQELINSLEIDHLTGVLNRRNVEFRLDEFIKNHDENLFSVAILDIDDFKKINDTYGHAFGDEVLKQVSSTIKSCLRGEDLVGRIGGEEFVIILSNTNIELAKDICNRIIKNIKSDNEKNLNLIVTASIGVVSYSGDHDLKSILKLADDNLYKAKNKGKNQVITQ